MAVSRKTMQPGGMQPQLSGHNQRNPDWANKQTKSHADICVSTRNPAKHQGSLSAELDNSSCYSGEAWQMCSSCDIAGLKLFILAM